MTTETQHGSVIVMDRRRGKLRAGQGLLQGLRVVWDHWAGSFRKNDNFSKIHGTFTVEYPEERLPMPQAYRNMPVLLFDDESGHELCTGCYQCQRICPPQVIHITQAKDPVTGKMVPAATEFIIEYDACMSCGFCAEVCPFDSIKMDHVYELSTANRAALTMRKAQLNRSISYYTGIAPGLWAEVQAGAMKKLQGSIKRRPDVIGLAASLTEKIKARRLELAAAAAAAPAAAAVSAPAAPAAPAAKLTPEEKAAKLAAMKAANANKGAAPAPAEAPVALSPA
ncbi:MAG: 4Fe-4S binding protein, partial [Chloroflexales bacterium]